MAVKIENFMKKQEPRSWRFFKETRIMGLMIKFWTLALLPVQLPRPKIPMAHMPHLGAFFTALQSFTKLPVLIADTLSFEAFNWQGFYMSSLFSKQVLKPKCLFSAC